MMNMMIESYNIEYDAYMIKYDNIEYDASYNIEYDAHMMHII